MTSVFQFVALVTRVVFGNDAGVVCVKRWRDVRARVRRAVYNNRGRKEKQRCAELGVGECFFKFESTPPSPCSLDDAKFYVTMNC